MAEKYKAIVFDNSKCVGCTHCMRKCPTQAIRVRNGKASINYDRCINCGNCVRACPNHAIHTQCDSYEDLKKYKFNVALVPSCLYAQFPHINSPKLIFNSMRNIGFDHAYEVARAADILSILKREMFIADDYKPPIISDICPACVELILTRYPSLKEHLIDFLPPIGLAAKLAREEAKELSGLTDSEIGVFYISPCPAKVEAIKSGYYSSLSELSGVLSVADTCLKLQSVDVTEVEMTEDIKASASGIGWAASGGEAACIPITRQLAADGIDNVISILRELEDGKLSNIDFVELHACHAGCVGGVLNITNTFIAESKIHTLRKTTLLNKTNTVDKVDKPREYYNIPWKWETVDVYTLDKDFLTSMDKMSKLEKILETLPMLDCGLCGSPSCRALAEDIVQGKATENMCIVYRENNDLK